MFINKNAIGSQPILCDAVPKIKINIVKLNKSLNGDQILPTPAFIIN